VRKITVIGLFLLSRFLLLISLPVEGLGGYGDYVHFYRLGGMGVPFLDYWTEYPPIYSFLLTLLYQLAGNRQHVFDLMLVSILTVAQAGGLWLFICIAEKIATEKQVEYLTWFYFAVTLSLPYGWWYSDSLAVFGTLLGIFWVIQGKDKLGGVALAMGTLTKLFPVLVLPTIWRWLNWRRALKVSLGTVGLTLMVYGALYIASPEMTVASVTSQGAKGTWETVWALIDGNYNTGNFGPEIERYDPSTAQVRRGNPPTLSPWLTFIPFAVIGGWFFWKAKIQSTRAAIGFLGITWCIFLLWTPGYSPQWVLYLLPIILLVLPARQATLFAILLTLVNLLEWPILLSRGYNWGLWLTIPLRTLLLVMLVPVLWQVVEYPKQPEEAS